MIWASTRQTCLQGLRQSETQTTLLSYRDQLENCKFTCSKFRYTFNLANNKGADQTAQMRRLVCAFVVRKHRRQVFSCRGPYHTLQTKPQHHEEEPQNALTVTYRRQKSKATSSLFPAWMIAKLEKTPSTVDVLQNKAQTQNHHKQWEQQLCLHNNRTTALKRIAVQATWGLECNLLVPNIRPRVFCW